MNEKELEIKDITPAKLLGRPLNEVETKYAPKILYVSGSLEIPLKGARVAIIGTRNPSDEGIRKTKEIVKNLVKENCIIVSGLARGIDTVAHRTAIKWGGKRLLFLETKHFVMRNRTMALISNASLIVEAG
ncbi:MAG: DNA-protecting protein DprA [Leptospiraceae bacterium]|nr:DNA-protecting protein DprA [Leptospiraceae bacterium]